MKFEITQGCTAFNFTVDGKKYDDLSREEREKVVDHVLAKVKEKVMDNYVGFQGIIEHFEYDSYEISPKCQQCGDSVTKMVINI